MKSYVVKAVLTQALELEVKAENVNQARRKADKTDINDWETVEDLGFEIEFIGEIEDGI
jgi:hypothetical protein